jgi:hypothetical protein
MFARDRGHEINPFAANVQLSGSMTIIRAARQCKSPRARLSPTPPPASQNDPTLGTFPPQLRDRQDARPLKKDQFMNTQPIRIRHQRLFEMLRQENQAASATARIKGFSIRKISAEEAEQIKATARRSMEARV